MSETRLEERVWKLEQALKKSMKLLAEAHDSDSMRQAARKFLDEL